MSGAQPTQTEQLRRCDALVEKECQPTAAAAPDACVELLEQVKKIVGGPRREAYGEPEHNYACLAALWQAWLDQRARTRPGPLKPEDVIVMMMLVKTARLATTPDHADSYRDAAGYAALGARVSRADLSR